MATHQFFDLKISSQFGTDGRYYVYINEHRSFVAYRKCIEDFYISPVSNMDKVFMKFVASRENMPFFTFFKLIDIGCFILQNDEKYFVQQQKGRQFFLDSSRQKIFEIGNKTREISYLGVFDIRRIFFTGHFKARIDKNKTDASKLQLTICILVMHCFAQHL